LNPQTLPKTKSFLWKKDRLLLLDQRLLPARAFWKVCRTAAQVAQGIREMVVRGAPAIGCAAAYGIVLAAWEGRSKTAKAQRAILEKSSALLLKSRPTAVNLKWALERMKKVWQEAGQEPAALVRRLEKEAVAIEVEDRLANQAMGRRGSALLPGNATVMTHCNTGSLATAGLGTAFGIIWTAFQEKKLRKVIASETRPYLQGARLTAWELKQEKIPFELITDNMAAYVMNTESVDAVIVGADRVAANGDTANKIGTYSLAVLAAHHRIPFYVAAPLSTIDLATVSGRDIPIEERSMEEVTSLRGQAIAPAGTRARHPAFDVTPASLIAAIVTEKGVAQPPFERSLASFFSQPALEISNARAEA
jgi:methylthioribose-1-phosphate isomerase